MTQKPDSQKYQEKVKQAHQEYSEHLLQRTDQLLSQRKKLVRKVSAQLFRKENVTSKEELIRVGDEEFIEVMEPLLKDAEKASQRKFSEYAGTQYQWEIAVFRAEQSKLPKQKIKEKMEDYLVKKRAEEMKGE